MKTKYWKAPKQPTVSVNFRLEHNEGEPVPRNGAACYSELMNRAISKSVKSVVLVESLSHLAYEEPEIKRWIADLNSLGFPCHIVSIEDQLQIRLILKEFKSKTHLGSTLMLLRLLWEKGMNKIPDLYFQAMDANPKADKLVQIQKAHKHPQFLKTEYKGTPYQYIYPAYNAGHTVTSYKSLKNIRRSELFKRLAKGEDVYDGHSCPVATTWRLEDNPEYNGYW